MTHSIDFEEYKKQTEPATKARAANWSVAIGLQRVDDLRPSNYLIQLARQNIDGHMSIDDAEEEIKTYYKQIANKTPQVNQENEADIVSTRIAKLLGTSAFSFTPAQLLSIHGALFKDILDDKITGALRTYDITKTEPVLNGHSVTYGGWGDLKQTLDYDFAQEKLFDHSALNATDQARHLAKFTSGIWQIHPFGEGNTRTTAVFMIKYLRSLGFDVNNDMFEKHSKYFRNALVRANYRNLQKQISYDMGFLNMFFDNLLLDARNDLESMDLHVAPGDISMSPSDKGGDKLLPAEQQFLQILLQHFQTNEYITSATAQELTGRSPQRVRQMFTALTDANILIASGENKARKYRLNKGIK